MSKNSYRELFLASKNYYFSIKNMKCPLFGDEIIYFSRSGFEHLIRKGPKKRSIKDQTRRFHLLRLATTVIQNSSHLKYRVVQKASTNSSIQFWTLSYLVNGTVLHVVIRQDGCGKKKFFSVM